MVKTPTTRHSKSQREPVTIELDPGQVSRVADEPASGESLSEETPAQQTETAVPGDAPVREPAEQPTAATETFRAEAASGYGFDETPRETSRAEEGGGTGSFDAGAPVREKSSRMNGLAAGVLGGVIALFGAGALQYSGLVGGTGSGPSLDGVNGEIAALKTQMASLSNTENGGEAAAREKMLSDALDQVKADVAALKGTVEARMGQAQGVGELRDKIAALEAAVGQAGNAAPVDLAPLNEKLAALDARVQSDDEEAAGQQGRLGALEQSVSQLSGKIDAQASQPKIALSIAASALKAALEGGRPFSAELETFAAIAPGAPQVAALRPYAEKGVATRADIAAGVDAAATAMVEAATVPDRDAGFFQNLLSSAQSLVKVRPVGAVAGTGVPETVARLEVAVKQGDYAGALAEYDTLPDAVKAAGAELADKLKARLEAETQVDALVADAMKA